MLSWASDLDSSREDLVASFDSGDIAEATDALHAVASLLKGALDPAQASPLDVQRGFDRLKLRHLKSAHNVLQESSVYGHFNEGLTALLQRSVEDDIRDLKLTCATASVADSRLLSCRASEEDIGGRVLVLGHVETVTSGTVGEGFSRGLGSSRRGDGDLVRSASERADGLCQHVVRIHCKEARRCRLSVLVVAMFPDGAYQFGLSGLDR